MPSEKQKRLDNVAKTIRERWGSHALQTPDSNALLNSPSVISTTYPMLDKALGIGGIPRGHLTEIIGVPTAGARTLSLHIVASAQAAGGNALYVDLGSTFDPEYALKCGVNRNTLLLSFPRDRREGMRVVRDFVELNQLSVLVLDFGVKQPPGQDVYRDMRKIIPKLKSSATALIVLHTFPFSQSAPLSEHSSLRLHVVWERWLTREGEESGWWSKVSIIKHQLGKANRIVKLPMAH